MELSLEKLSGRTFKLFLRKHTGNTAEAIGSGALVTGILQSSSVVIMTILTFVGAGIITMRNALAVTIGSNFGTTIDSWMVASIGFKVDIDLIALPMVGIAATAMVFLNEQKKIYEFTRFILGFGFLFLGLGFMKESMTELFRQFDFSQFEGYPRIAFVGIGFVMTALIQSSSATIAILLSALNTGEMPFEAAIAAVIGSELATTLKIVVGSLKGSGEKMQLAVGNVLFNVFITIVAFIFMDAFMRLTEIIAGKDILLRLVAFQSMINLVGVIVFIPFLNPYAKLLEKYIRKKDRRSTFVIDDKLINVQEIAFDSFEQDAELLIHRVIQINLEAFATEKKLVHPAKEILTTLEERNKLLTTYEERYDDLKKSEGELLMYSLKMIEHYPEQHKRIEELISAIRHAIHSAKAMKDVQHNRIEFHESADDVKFRYYNDFKKHLESFYSEIDAALKKRPAERSLKCAHLIEQAHSDYIERQNKVYDAASRRKLNSEDVSSLLNVNREMYTSCKTIVQAIEQLTGNATASTVGDIP
jgi:phosphate:Na+ symporter